VQFAYLKSGHLWIEKLTACGILHGWHCATVQKNHLAPVLHDSAPIGTHTHTHLTALCPGLPGWAGTRKVKTNLDYTEAKDSERQWPQLGRMQVCTSNQTDNHASTPLLSFLQARCPSCCPANSVKALKAKFQFRICLRIGTLTVIIKARTTVHYWVIC